MIALGPSDFTTRRGKLYDPMVYKLVDWKSHKVLRGELQDFRLDDVRLLLDTTLKAEERRLPCKRGSETEPTAGDV